MKWIPNKVEKTVVCWMDRTEPLTKALPVSTHGYLRLPAMYYTRGTKKEWTDNGDYRGD